MSVTGSVSATPSRGTEPGRPPNRRRDRPPAGLTPAVTSRALRAMQRHGGPARDPCVFGLGDRLGVAARPAALQEIVVFHRALTVGVAGSPARTLCGPRADRSRAGTGAEALRESGVSPFSVPPTPQQPFTYKLEWLLTLSRRREMIPDQQAYTAAPRTNSTTNLLFVWFELARSPTSSTAVLLP